jgi:hypothetical protein
VKLKTKFNVLEFALNDKFSVMTVRHKKGALKVI